MELNRKLSDKAEIKILLVDDREDNLVSIETILERDGYTFRKARSGKEALKILLKEFDFTLILMDVEMPEINGFETATMIYEREKLKHIPIIFITANSYSEEYVFKGYKAGAVDYIYKPINSELLRAKVGVFVELYHKNHELRAQEHMLKYLNNELEGRVRERTAELEIKNSQLELINAQLRRVNEDLDNFVYTASHDLKAPILNIEGLLINVIELFRPQIQADAEASELFKMIDISINRFKSTIQDLTEITKIQKNNEEEEELLIDPEEILEDVKLSIRDLIVESKTKIMADFKDCPRLKFSKKNLKSIIHNLLTNAIKYKAPDRDPLIEITTKRTTDYCILSFRDNGLGIDKNNENKIFSLFKRLHTHVEGSGIGLYIVKRIIANAGGKIELQSEVGKGSTFKVYFKHELNENKGKDVSALPPMLR
jgi:two-component system sensor histidine kinase/response regulator